ncbi:MAG: anion permease [Peptococcaceae bacterium]|nr:anion permease [Peptococcaceae bacterium]
MTSNRSNIWKYIIVFIVPLIFLVIPKTEIYTREMAIAIAATFCFLAWAAVELTNILIPSLLWPAVLILTGTVTYADVYGCFVDSAIVAVAATFILAATLDRVGLLRRMAFSVAKIFGGSYVGTVYGLFAATFIVAIATFASGECIFAAITYGAVMAFGLAKTRAGSVLMMSGMLGGVTMRMIIYYPIFCKTMQKSVSSVDPNFTISQMDLLIYNWPVIIFCLAFIYLLIKIFVKPEDVAHLNSKEYYISELEKMGKMTTAEKLGVVVLLGIMAMIMTSSIHGLDYMYAFVIGAAIMFIFGYGSNEDIGGAKPDMIFFLASCMAIGSVCSAVGITSAISEFATPILQGLGEVATLVITLVFGFILNLCMTPMAMLGGFTGMLYDLFLNVGLNPMAGVMAFYQSTDLVILPYEFLSFLYFFAYGIMSMKDFFVMHLMKSVLWLVFFAVVFIPYWMFAGLI